MDTDGLFSGADAEPAIEKTVPLRLLQPFVDGFVSDPGTSDLDNEQPITVRVLLGDWRKARAATAGARKPA